MLFSTTEKAKPILKWAGGKAKLLSQMLPFFPKEISRYGEPFLGGASCFLALQSDVPALLNDSNPELVELYQVVRDEPERLHQCLQQFQQYYSESFYYQLRSTVPNGSVEKAARTLFLNKTCFNGLYRVNAQGQFNVPFGKRLKCPELASYDHLLKVSQKFKKAEIHCGDFEVFLEQFGAGDFIYCDPPYEPLNPTSVFTSYTPGGFSQQDQKRLKEAAVRAAARGACVAISNSNSPFILELYREFPQVAIQAARAINSKGTQRGKIEEKLILINCRDRTLSL